MSGETEVGRFDAEITLIKPSEVCPDQFMKSAPIWSPEMTNLEVGHRGVGVSYHDDPEENSDYLENTILSLNTVRTKKLGLVDQFFCKFLPILSNTKQ